MSGEDLAAEVAAALREAGAAVGDGALLATLTRTPQKVNPWDAAPADPTTHSVAVVVAAYSTGQVDGTLIQAQDRRVLIEAAGVSPAAHDMLTIGGVVYNIITVATLAPGGVDLMYEAQCRRQ